MVRAGLEPGTSGFQVRCPNHSTTLPPTEKLLNFKFFKIDNDMIEPKLRNPFPPSPQKKKTTTSGQRFRPGWVSSAESRTFVHKLTRGFDLRWAQIEMLANWPFPQCVTITQHANNLKYHVIVAILGIKV